MGDRERDDLVENFVTLISEAERKVQERLVWHFLMVEDELGIRVGDGGHPRVRAATPRTPGRPPSPAMCRRSRNHVHLAVVLWGNDRSGDRQPRMVDSPTSRPAFSPELEALMSVSDLPDPTPAEPQGRSPFTPLSPAAAASRRNLLKAAGLVALVGGGGAALAACSSGAAGPSTGAPSSAAPPSASSKASSSAKVPSVPTADVPQGGGFIMPSADYVVTQPEKGTYKAFSKICTHAGCPVSQIVNGEIVCTCHGSHFSIKDGSVLSGPAQASLPEAKATVSGDQIVISA
jgi:Rieske Fe-S protein